MASTDLTLGYWAFRGKGGEIRSLLAYCGIPYKQKLYSDFQEWFAKDKQELGLDYPNLPYLIDGDKKFTEKDTIMRYIAVKAGKRELIGDTDEKWFKVETALGVLNDVRDQLAGLAFTKGDFETEKTEAFTKGLVKTKLDFLNKNLEGKEWLCGFFSIADFNLFECVEIIDAMEPTILEKYLNLTTFRKRFSEIPEYKTHRQSSDFLYSLYCPVRATWNNVKINNK